MGAAAQGTFVDVCCSQSANLHRAAMNPKDKGCHDIPLEAIELNLCSEEGALAWSKI